MSGHLPILTQAYLFSLCSTCSWQLEDQMEDRTVSLEAFFFSGKTEKSPKFKACCACREGCVFIHPLLPRVTQSGCNPTSCSLLPKSTKSAVSGNHIHSCTHTCTHTLTHTHTTTEHLQKNRGHLKPQGFPLLSYFLTVPGSTG